MSFPSAPTFASHQQVCTWKRLGPSKNRMSLHFRALCALSSRAFFFIFSPSAVSLFLEGLFLGYPLCGRLQVPSYLFHLFPGIFSLWQPRLFPLIILRSNNLSLCSCFSHAQTRFPASLPRFLSTDFPSLQHFLLATWR